MLVGVSEMTELVCRVGWGEGLEFTWARLTARGEREVLGGAQPGASPATSVLTYQGRLHGGRDSVECKAREAGGRYGQPCTYRIIIRGY